MTTTTAKPDSSSHNSEEFFDIKSENLTLGAPLGRIFGLDSEGQGRAVINVAQDKKSGSQFAVKRFFVDDASEEAIKLIRHEVVSMRQLKYDHVLECLGSFALPNIMEVWLISPLMEMGSVRKILDSHFPEGIPESAASPIIRDILLGLVHLHERGIVHRALKAAHVLIDRTGRAKLSGLRYSCSLYDSVVEASCSASVGCMTQDRYDYPLYVSLKHLNWMSPEILQQNLLGYNEKSDIYSLGVTVCEMANGIVPFSDMPSTYMLLEKMRGSAPKLLDSTHCGPSNQDLVFSGQKPADSGVGASVGSCSNLPRGNSNYNNRTFSDNFHDFVDQCCLKDAETRQPASLLLSHPFIKQLKKSSNPGLSLASLVQASTVDGASAVVASADDAEDSLTFALDTKMVLDDIEWEF